MYNKFERKISEARKRKNVYIIKKIVKDFNEFVLFLAMRHNFASLINTNTVFSSVNNVFKSVLTNSINVNTDSTNVANKLVVVNKINYNQSSVKMYKLWHWRFVYLKFVKLRNLYKIIILKKLILIVYNHNNICEIYILIKFNNSKSHEINKRKIAVFNLISINIYDLLSLFRNDYAYFLKIVYNYFWKT